MSGGADVSGDANDDDAMMTIGCVTLEETYATLLGHLGVQRTACRREQRKAYNRIVSEIYSPPRITKMLSCLPSLKLLPGYAFDITVDDPEDQMPWDFNLEANEVRRGG